MKVKIYENTTNVAAEFFYERGVPTTVESNTHETTGYDFVMYKAKTLPRSQYTEICRIVCMRVELSHWKVLYSCFFGILNSNEFMWGFPASAGFLLWN